MLVLQPNEKTVQGLSVNIGTQHVGDLSIHCPLVQSCVNM